MSPFYWYHKSYTSTEGRQGITGAEGCLIACSHHSKLPHNSPLSYEHVHNFPPKQQGQARLSQHFTVTILVYFVAVKNPDQKQTWESKVCLTHSNHRSSITEVKSEQDPRGRNWSKTPWNCSLACSSIIKQENVITDLTTNMRNASLPRQLCLWQADKTKLITDKINVFPLGDVESRLWR